MNAQLTRIAFAVTTIFAFAGCSDSNRAQLEKLEAETQKLDSQLSVTRKLLESAESELSILKQENAKQNPKPGIGLPRARVIQTLSKQLSVKFKDETAITPGRELFATNIGAVGINLWGPADNLNAITIIGQFEGDYRTETMLVLVEILDLATPEWAAHERGAWFAKAAARSDKDVTVSTLRGDIVVKVVSATIDNHTVRIISFTPYQP